MDSLEEHFRQFPGGTLVTITFESLSLRAQMLQNLEHLSLMKIKIKIKMKDKDRDADKDKGRYKDEDKDKDEAKI